MSVNDQTSLNAPVGETDWSVIVSDIPATVPGRESGTAMPPDTLRALIGFTGQNPDDFEEKSVPEMPGRRFTRQAETGYGEFAEQTLFNAMSDQERIRTAVLRGGDETNVLRFVDEMADRAIQRNIEELIFPEGDNEAIAKGFAPGPVRIPLEYVEELSKTPEGQKDLRDLWTKTQTERVRYANNLEYQLYLAEALSTDGAVLSADLRRLAEDRFGGKGRAFVNLVKDIGYGTANTATSAGLGLASYGLNLLSLLRADRSMKVFGPLTASETEALENPPIAQAQEAVEGASEAMSNALYRAQARTGNWAYDQLASPLASGAGSMVPFLATGGLPTWARLGMTTGIGYQEAYDSVYAATGNRENARLIAMIAGPLSGALEFVGMESIFRAWRTPSITGQLGWGLAGAVIGEGLTEFGQSIISGIAAEIGLAAEGAYAYDPERISNAIKNALVEGGYGAILGGAFGAAGSRPLHSMARETMRRN